MQKQNHTSFIKLLTVLLLSFTLITPALADTADSADEYIHIHKKDPGRAALMNIIPFGVGSFQQGDMIGGTSIAVVDGLSVLIGIAPFTYAPQLKEGGGWGMLMSTAWALGGLLLGRVMGVIAPFQHFNDYQRAKASQVNGLSEEEQSPATVQLLNYQFSF